VGAGDGSTAVVVLRHGDAEVVVARLGAVRPDMALVDALCRLQLAARRLGCSIALREPSPELRALLDLVGLAVVIGPTGPTGPAGPPG
jgi:anti-anti-sigma regulatory factor